MQLPLYPLIRFYFRSTGTRNLNFYLANTPPLLVPRLDVDIGTFITDR